MNKKDPSIISTTAAQVTSTTTTTTTTSTSTTTSNTCSASVQFVGSAATIPADISTPFVKTLNVPFSRTISFNTLFVTLDIIHPDPTTITIKLISPQNTIAILHQQGNTLAQISTYPNPVAPIDAFVVFDSENSQGNWQLQIEDNNSGGGAGVLNEFSLNFCSGKPQK